MIRRVKKPSDQWEVIFTTAHLKKGVDVQHIQQQENKWPNLKMDKGPKQIFLWRKHMNSQQSASPVIRKTQTKNHSEAMVGGKGGSAACVLGMVLWCLWKPYTHFTLAFTPTPHHLLHLTASSSSVHSVSLCIMYHLVPLERLSSWDQGSLAWWRSIHLSQQAWHGVSLKVGEPCVWCAACTLVI